MTVRIGFSSFAAWILTRFHKASSMSRSVYAAILAATRADAADFVVGEVLAPCEAGPRQFQHVADDAGFEMYARWAFRRCADQLDAALAASGWQPIATAPKDAPALLLLAGQTNRALPPVIDIGRWIDGDPHTRGVRTESMWRYRRSNPGYDKEHQPTHWMPLPAPPEAA